MRALAPLPMCFVLLACGATSEDNSDPTAMALASALVAACPASAPDDEAARAACGEALVELASLRDNVADPMLWGAEPKEILLANVVLQAPLTELSPRVFRKNFLSTFTFEAGATTEQAGDYLVLRVPVRFRNAMSDGAYPYPFWHSASKWKSYEQSTSILFFFQGTKLVAAARSQVMDAARPHVEKLWDGAWTWSNGQEPHVNNFRSIFSASNPYIDRLDTAYVAVSAGLTEQSCMACHSPDNSTRMQRLALLNYPAQALSGRHDVVRMLEQNMMPPGVGLADTLVRLDLTQRAKDFAAAGDEALAFEGEVVP